MWIPANPLWELLPSMTNSMAPLLFHRVRLCFAQDGVYSMPFLKTFSSVKKLWHVYIVTKQNETVTYVLQYTSALDFMHYKFLSLKCFRPEEKCLSLGFQTFRCDFWTATYRSISCLGRGRVMVRALISWLPNTAPLVYGWGPFLPSKGNKAIQAYFSTWKKALWCTEPIALLQANFKDGNFCQSMHLTCSVRPPSSARSSLLSDS